MSIFKGIYTALITPFYPDGSIDLNGILFNVEEQLKAQIHGLVLFGSTGESMTLDDQEVEKISYHVATLVDGKVPLVMGATHGSTKEAVKKAKAAQKNGATAILVAPPYYNKPTQEGLYRHYSTLADSVSIPIILYNNPSRSGVLISDELQQRLSFIAMKDCSEKIGSLLDPVQPIIAGDDAFLLPALSLGSQCLFSALSNVFPSEFVKIFDLCQQNDFHSAYDFFQELIPFVLALSLETNPIVVKKLMQLYDKPSGAPRLPLTDASPSTEKVLRQYAEKYQLCKT